MTQINLLTDPKKEKLTHEDIDNLQSPVSAKEMEFIVKNLPTKRIPGPNDFTSESYQTSKMEIITICYGLSRVSIKIYILNF